MMLARLLKISMSQWIRWLLAVLLVPPTLISIILVLVDTIRRRGHPQGHFLSLRDEPPVHVDKTKVQLYTYGNDLYQAMLEDIEHAQKRILFETFIWKNDVIGNKFKDALQRAAQRGVEVYIIYDQFANLVVSAAFFQFDPVIHVLRYPLISFPFRPLTLKTYARDHRKVLIIDDLIGYLGGYNIGDLYARKWRDTHVRVQGPGAWEIENSFIDFWNAYKKKHHAGLSDLTRRDWNSKLIVQRNDPMLFMFPIRSMYLETIDRAQESFYLTNPYFIPDRAMLYSLLKATRRGVDVRILVPAKSNHIIADWLSHRFYTQCLKGGIRLLLYSGAMIHAKTATADGVWSTVGTANLDRLSMVGNFEVNLELYDHAVARQMEKIFEYDVSQAYELTLANWEKRPLYWKVSEYLLSTFRPLF